MRWKNVLKPSIPGGVAYIIIMIVVAINGKGRIEELL
jgi:hypothetical protein